ncbi:hypothetical protein LGH83_11265 [Lichenihabitans sp. PAMC28606]|uniref:hypothetical protein n=1 Tax=Lichenihabitans sp. PAMC28606 TaxID=2880932 RepID=UPI001D0A34AD|nr:hypothetical protein [Lichenihabitans sp. PAMC28606]UDL93192.1 hypothetical protein LGH83_11265 [Lichenihabitans sp. PAMC28606]
MSQKRYLVRTFETDGPQSLRIVSTTPARDAAAAIQAAEAGGLAFSGAVALEIHCDDDGRETTLQIARFGKIEDVDL